MPVQVPFYTRLDERGFDVEAMLEDAVTDRTVALYINTPNNPTGRVLCRCNDRAMLRVAKRHDLWVLCDEAYEEIYFDTAPPDAVWKHADIRDRAIAFHTLSKTYGFAGARVGFTHGRRPSWPPCGHADLPHLLRTTPHAVRRGRSAAPGRRVDRREPVRSIVTPGTRQRTPSECPGPRAERSFSWM